MAKTASEMVTLIDEAIEDLVTGKRSQTTVGRKTYTFYDLDELQGLREYYARQDRLGASTSPRGLRTSPIHLGGTVPTEGQD